MTDGRGQPRIRLVRGPVEAAGFVDQLGGVGDVVVVRRWAGREQLRAVRPRLRCPTTSAATIGALRLPARTSDDDDLPVAAASPVMPRMSSTS